METSSEKCLRRGACKGKASPAPQNCHVLCVPTCFQVKLPFCRFFPLLCLFSIFLDVAVGDVLMQFVLVTLTFS